MEEIDLQKKTVTKDNGHYIMIKRTNQQEDETMVNIYEPNLGTPKYIKQLLDLYLWG